MRVANFRPAISSHAWSIPSTVKPRRKKVAVLISGAGEWIDVKVLRIDTTKKANSLYTISMTTHAIILNYEECMLTIRIRIIYNTLVPITECTIDLDIYNYLPRRLSAKAGLIVRCAHVRLLAKRTFDN